MSHPLPHKKQHPYYPIWTTIKTRCLCKTNKAYPYYGGRGITLCDRWLDFWAFVEDMGPRPKGYSVERIDNDKGYSKENCRWATSTDQNRNRRNTIRVDGKPLTLVAEETGITVARLRKCIARGKPIESLRRIDDTHKRRRQMQEAAQRLGLTISAINFRLKLGWSWKRALNTPRVQMEMTQDAKALRIRVAEAAKRLGMTTTAIRARLSYGWSEEEAFHTPQTMFIVRGLTNASNLSMLPSCPVPLPSSTPTAYLG